MKKTAGDSNSTSDLIVNKKFSGPTKKIWETLKNNLKSLSSQNISEFDKSALVQARTILSSQTNEEVTDNPYSDKKYTDSSRKDSIRNSYNVTDDDPYSDKVYKDNFRTERNDTIISAYDVTDIVPPSNETPKP
jgi:hypothetical protein